MRNTSRTYSQLQCWDSVWTEYLPVTSCWWPCLQGHCLESPLATCPSRPPPRLVSQHGWCTTVTGWSCQAQILIHKILCTGFSRLLESPGIVFVKFPVSGKSWKMSGPGKSWKSKCQVLEFTRQWCGRWMQWCVCRRQNMLIHTPPFYIVHP